MHLSAHSNFLPRVSQPIESSFWDDLAWKSTLTRLPISPQLHFEGGASEVGHANS